MAKIARYEVAGGEVYGLLDESDGTLRRLAGSPFDSLDTTDRTDRLSDVRLLEPVAAPRIFGAGLNYVAHIEEAGQRKPEIPMLFMKPTTSATGPEAPIVYPRQGKEVHFEGELVAVIGCRARHVSEADALDYVLGYTCGNDVSERVIQFAEMEMGCLLVGKGFDSFSPLGPVVATDLDPTNLRLETRVNGETRQSSSTADLLFPVARLVSYLSDALTLLPGDMIMTGTPSGVGPMVPGDTIEVEIENIGILRNTVTAEA